MLEKPTQKTEVTRISTSRGKVQEIGESSYDFPQQYPACASSREAINVQPVSSTALLQVPGETQNSQGTTPRTISNYLNANQCVLSYSTETNKLIQTGTLHRDSSHPENNSVTQYDWLVDSRARLVTKGLLGGTTPNTDDEYVDVARNPFEHRGETSDNQGLDKNISLEKRQFRETQSTFGKRLHQKSQSSPDLADSRYHPTPSPSRHQHRPELVPEITRTRDLTANDHPGHENSVHYRRSKDYEDYLRRSQIPLQNSGISAVIH